jgi:hypothetical protein
MLHAATCSQLDQPRQQGRNSHQQFSHAAVASEFKTAVDAFLQENKVTAFIKGTRDFPQCGFSNTVLQVRVCGYMRGMSCGSRCTRDDSAHS